ncbi:unnamed protein product [Zymoseptoria tritici ST99CH_3D7]|uniref:Uncharacterized protein n=1 Tax=Zymoseptoria tritici (strain ST99CH_3D7) TaxID=1276538 RepID=A0A1X7RY53_ZYMT9|nr:unnamed protein product [Zymoseptoria tritici ST99CH_3D7]
MARAVQFAACEHIGVSTIQTLSEATGLINNVEPYSPGRTLKPVKTSSLFSIDVVGPKASSQGSCHTMLQAAQSGNYLVSCSVLLPKCTAMGHDLPD